MKRRIDFYCWNRCSTCRKARDFLLQRKVELHDRDFFKNPFTRDELEKLLQGRSASGMFSFKSPSFKKLGLDKNGLSSEELIDLMLKEPRLIRRPVVSIDGESHFGASEAVLRELID